MAWQGPQETPRGFEGGFFPEYLALSQTNQALTIYEVRGSIFKRDFPALAATASFLDPPFEGEVRPEYFTNVGAFIDLNQKPDDLSVEDYIELKAAAVAATLKSLTPRDWGDFSDPVYRVYVEHSKIDEAKVFITALHRAWKLLDQLELLRVHIDGIDKQAIEAMARGMVEHAQISADVVPIKETLQRDIEDPERERAMEAQRIAWAEAAGADAEAARTLTKLYLDGSKRVMRERLAAEEQTGE